MKRNIAVQHKDFQRLLSATATGLIFCTIAFHSPNGHATEARTFTVIAHPASANYVGNADVTQTSASNVAQMKGTQIARPDLTQKSVQPLPGRDEKRKNEGLV